MQEKPPFDNLPVPHKEALKRLSLLASRIHIAKQTNTASFCADVREIAASFEHLEHSFPCLSFALPDGLGHTLLMRAMIELLKSTRGFQNFLIIAPSQNNSDRIENTLRSEQDEPQSDGYREFEDAPNPALNSKNFWRTKSGSSSGTVHISHIDELLDGSPKQGASPASGRARDAYLSYLKSLPNLIVLIDQAHHCRTPAMKRFLNNLEPKLGIELTSTPAYGATRRNKFKNIAFSYSLAEGQRDKLLREILVGIPANISDTPRSNAENDSINLHFAAAYHEEVKQHAHAAAERGLKPVKPLMLVLASDNQHADKLQELLTSSKFMDGRYEGKIQRIVSGESPRKTAKIAKLLVAAENPDTPIEIIIQVDEFEEGWNLQTVFTIIPLGRALSRNNISGVIEVGTPLPYGKYVDDQFLDSAMIVSREQSSTILRQARVIFGGHELPLVSGDKNKTYRRQYTARASKAEIPNESKRSNTPEQHAFIREAASWPDAPSGAESYIQNSSSEPLSAHEASAPFLLDQTPHSFNYGAERLCANGRIAIPRIAAARSMEADGLVASVHLDFSEIDRLATESKLIVRHIDDAKPRHLMRLQLTPSGDLYGKSVSTIRSITCIDYETNKEVVHDLARQLHDHMLNVFGKEAENILTNRKSEIAEVIRRQLISEQPGKPTLELRQPWQKLPALKFRSLFRPIDAYRDPLPAAGKISQFILRGFRSCVYDLQKLSNRTELSMALCWIERQLTGLRSRNLLSGFHTHTAPASGIIRLTSWRKPQTQNSLSKRRLQES